MAFHDSKSGNTYPTLQMATEALVQRYDDRTGTEVPEYELELELGLGLG